MVGWACRDRPKITISPTICSAYMHAVAAHSKLECGRSTLTRRGGFGCVPRVPRSVAAPRCKVAAAREGIGAEDSSRPYCLRRRSCVRGSSPNNTEVTAVTEEPGAAIKEPGAAIAPHTTTPSRAALAARSSLSSKCIEAFSCMLLCTKANRIAMARAQFPR